MIGPSGRRRLERLIWACKWALTFTMGVAFMIGFKEVAHAGSFEELRHGTFMALGGGFVANYLISLGDRIDIEKIIRRLDYGDKAE